METTKVRTAYMNSFVLVVLFFFRVVFFKSGGEKSVGSPKVFVRLVCVFITFIIICMFLSSWECVGPFFLFFLLPYFCTPFLKFSFLSSLCSSVFHVFLFILRRYFAIYQVAGSF